MPGSATSRETTRSRKLLSRPPHVNPYYHAEGFWGLERSQEANDAFRDAIKQSPKYAYYRVRWGRLFLERFNKDEARGLFRKPWRSIRTIRRTLGLALVSAQDFGKGAVDLAEKAAGLDPSWWRRAKCSLIWR